MKKQLEAELISIAHRILKLKNKSELHQLHQETQNLYEKLSVLMFVETHFAEAKPTIGLTEAIAEIEAAFEAKAQQPQPVAEIVAEAVETNTPDAVAEAEEEPVIAEKEAAIDEEHQVETASETTEEQEEEIEEEIDAETESSSEQHEEEEEPEAIEASDEIEEEPTASTQEEVTETPAEENNFKPAFELSFDTKDEEIEEQIKEEIKNVSPQITFDDLLGANYADPVFVKPEELEKEKEASDVIPIGRSYNDSAQVISINKDQATSLNDRMAKGIIIGLNDRIAFMNHLFSNSSEDYNRVLSQLMTFDNYGEAKNFIDTMVKPDYNNWEGKDEYAERFMEIVEKRFS